MEVRLADTRRSQHVLRFELGGLQEDCQVHKLRCGDARQSPHQKLECNAKRVTLPSAEAELGALVKAAAESIGIMQMAEGLGDSVTSEVFVDSSAALSVTQRKGSGKCATCL